MTLSEEQVRYVAGLANLNLSDEEVRRFAADLGGILTHMEKLRELDTTGVEPMAQVLYEAEETATLREDREHRPLGQAAALANTPLAGAGMFKVPKVIER
jgi:aspartyl-tRNA(Asn)/glutamyl-tRNA(Gln) amidotransferase subunit C